jgi:hypothetical protein
MMLQKTLVPMLRDMADSMRYVIARACWPQPHPAIVTSAGPLRLTYMPANPHPMQGKHAYGATGIASSSATMPTSVLSPSKRPQTAPAPAVDGKAYAFIPSAMPPAATEGAAAAAVTDGAPMDEKTCVAGGSSPCAWPLSCRGSTSLHHCPAITPQVI